MRKAALVSVLVVVTATSAWAATAMHPYRLTPTRRCLIRHHLRIAPSHLPILEIIEWELTKNPRGPGIDIEFVQDPAHAIRAARVIRRRLRANGLTKAQISRHLARRANVLIVTNSRDGMTTTQLTTVVDCLRG